MALFLQDFLYSLPATGQVFRVYRLFFDTSPLYNSLYSETAPFQDFAEGTNRSARLSEPDVEGKRRGAGRDKQGAFPSKQRDGNAARRFSHHSVNQAVEEYLQRTRHVAPITGRADNERIAFLELLPDEERIVCRKHAFPARAARHAPRTGLDVQVRHV